MDKIFDRAYEVLSDYEGGLVDSPFDYGGLTNFGWTQRELIALGYDLQVENLTSAKAKELFYKHYWLEPSINQIKSPLIAIEVFEQGVNMGPVEAIRRLQETYNLLSGNQIAEDGIIGTETLSAVNAYHAVDTLYKALNCEQYDKYKRLVQKDRTQRKFLHGWLRRVTLIKEVK